MKNVIAYGYLYYKWPKISVFTKMVYFMMYNAEVFASHGRLAYNNCELK